MEMIFVSLIGFVSVVYVAAMIVAMVKIKQFTGRIIQ